MINRNRLHNCKNPYQGAARRVLCVCSAGLLRSPTAANVLHKEFGYNTRAVGYNKDYALIPIDDCLIRWADEIVVMEHEIEEYLKEEFVISKPIINLGVPDNFEYMDEQLQDMILETYTKGVADNESID